MKKVLTIIFAAILPSMLFAQTGDTEAARKADSVMISRQADSLKALAKQIEKLKERVEEQQEVINQLDKPVKSMDAKRVYADTIDTVNDSIKVALFNDGTWKYVMDASLKRNSEVFSKAWEGRATNPYHIALSDLPKKWSIWLVDSLGQYHVPYHLGKKPTSHFGIRWGRRHQGVDLGLTTGDPIYATFDGRVRYAGQMGGYGNIVILRHTNGLETFYGHLSAFKVKEGDWVNAGDVIALGGNTGRSTGPHLHFETRYMGYAFDPEWIIDFTTGDLRHRLFVLRKIYFSESATADQDFDDEEAVEERIKKEEAARVAAQYHTVRSGDTLSRIAVKYHTTVGAICRMNGIRETTILQIGKRLKVH